MSRLSPPLRSLPVSLTTAAIAATALLVVPACKEPKPPSQPPDQVGNLSRKELLGAFGQCALKSAQEFQTAAGALDAAVKAWAAQPDDTTREAARTAFREAMRVWQINEVMGFGPAAPASAAGGQDLRDQIYSWPLVSRCAVEEEIVARGYEAQDFGTLLVNRRGLGALEYLLFYEGSDTACGSSSPIVASGSWAALEEEEREARKRQYAVRAANDVLVRAAALVDAWDPDEGNFVATLETAGPDNRTYASTQIAFNNISDALFYVEGMVKDTKLAAPLGLRDCDSTTCPELLESRISGLSRENIRANLVGFRRIFEGCADDYSGLGFDDLLVAVNATELADRMKARIVDANAAIDAIEESDLATALAQDPESVRGLYDGIKGITDILKTEMMSVLDLELPQSLEGDND